MQYCLFIKERKEQTVVYVQYMGDDTKGLKHKLHFYQIFLHSLLVYPSLLPFAGLHSAVKYNSTMEVRHLK